MLKSVPELKSYVFDEPFSGENQNHVLVTCAMQYGGCLAVIAQPFFNDKEDPSIRDGYLQGEFGIAGIVHEQVWQATGNMDPMIRTAADFLDALLALAVAAIIAWKPVETPYGCPMIIGEEEVILPGEDWKNTDVRGLRVRCPLLFPQIVFNPQHNK